MSPTDLYGSEQNTLSSGTSAVKDLGFFCRPVIGDFSSNYLFKGLAFCLDSLALRGFCEVRLLFFVLAFISLLLFFYDHFFRNPMHQYQLQNQEGSYTGKMLLWENYFKPAIICQVTSSKQVTLPSFLKAQLHISHTAASSLKCQPCILFSWFVRMSTKGRR